MSEDNIIFFPPPNELGQVLNQIAKEDRKKEETFRQLGERVLEHSKEIKRLIKIEKEIYGAEE